MTLLAHAFAPIPPGPPVPPGPQAQDWSPLAREHPGHPPGSAPSAHAGRPAAAVPVLSGGPAPAELISWFGALGHLLLFGSEFHRDEATGDELSVRRRPIPSAGAAYPVQLHLRLGPWRLAYHQERDSVFDLSEALGPPAHHRPEHHSPEDHRLTSARLSFTVLPGRSFSRYRHRAWTLWIADAAYAAEAAIQVMGGPSPGGLRTSPDLSGPRELARRAGLPLRDGWPTASPELTILGLELGQAAPPENSASVTLPGLTPLPPRRSFPISELSATAASRAPRPHQHQETLLSPQHCSGQGWLGACADVVLFTAPKTKDPHLLRHQLISVHRQAARLTYAAAAEGVSVRPVSGFTDVPGHRLRCLHALARDPNSPNRKSGEHR